jgi:hypothetical protein
MFNRVSQREGAETVETMVETLFFLWPQRVSNKQHSDSGNHGNKVTDKTDKIFAKTV